MIGCTGFLSCGVADGLGRAAKVVLNFAGSIAEAAEAGILTGKLVIVCIGPLLGCEAKPALVASAGMDGTAYITSMVVVAIATVEVLGQGLC